tara:strand:- start:329 stop:952 length:624 start_codon:yes stop_codon:yes gene_type:complete
MKKNNIDLIHNFLVGDNLKLLVNQVNDEIGCFYKVIIGSISKKIDIQILDDSNFINDNNDLFGGKKVYLTNSNNSKLIEQISNTNSQNIIFTDYKNYKKFFKKFILINGYDFEKDLKYYLETFLEIKNDELFNYCLSYPHLIFSETSKYIINNINYKADYIVNEKENFILKIRKDIFRLKKSEIDVKQLFLKLKTEMIYKKFNFLAY